MAHTVQHARTWTARICGRTVSGQNARRGAAASVHTPTCGWGKTQQI